ncbi:phosphoglycerate kinase [Columbia Basin potato purple top phytoplasma]|uniref:Phosphoglycerate kinase n=1 Tax=Columbia Basin potato purple top phytoplasma TaxID=307134 RepID=A0ABT5LAM5_9MOLU|nr:phosphoglycerate kinase [Columbia Basin potato purple top phytoplasma]MDC9032226.1 phosphoglycerate kinase [Columbia Basin potato purple top phytoplasma]
MQNSLTNLDISKIFNKKILLRVDLNVPLNDDGFIIDDNRIKSILPTLEYLKKNQGKIIILSHLGRIKKQEDLQKFSLKVVVERLSFYLNQQVKFVPVTRGKLLESEINNLSPGSILLMENTRFEDLNDKKESKNDPRLGKYWASLGDLFVNDAFGMCHRIHASNVGIATYIKEKCLGFLIEKEIKFLNQIMDCPKRPLVAVLGGSKVSDKIKIIEQLLAKVDFLLIGGAMSFTFRKAQGFQVGNSLLEENEIPLVQKLLNSVEGKKIVLPQDFVCGSSFSSDTEAIIFDYNKIPSGMMGLDIGPKTISLFQYYLMSAKTIVWNGPLGVFEFEKFSQGTKMITQIISGLNKNQIIKIVGGGDTVAAVFKFRLENNFSHISTGGGAFLEYLERKQILVLECIKTK